MARENKMKTREWLERICNKEHEWRANPFSVDMHGEQWTCATSGQLLVLLRGDHDDAKPNAKADKKVADLFSEIVSKPPVVCDTAKLRAWAGEPKYPGNRMNSRTASLGGLPIDANLVAQALAGVPNGECTVALPGNDKSPLVIRGDGWMACVAARTANALAKAGVLNTDLSEFAVVTVPAEKRKRVRTVSGSGVRASKGGGSPKTMR